MSQTYTIHQNLSMDTHNTAPDYGIDLERPLARDELCGDPAHLNEPFSARYGCARAISLYIWDDGCWTRLHLWTARPPSFLISPATEFTQRFVRMAEAGYPDEALEFILEHGTSPTAWDFDPTITDDERTVAAVDAGLPAPVTGVVEIFSAFRERLPTVASSQRDSAARTIDSQAQQSATPDAGKVLKQRDSVNDSVVADSDWAVVDGDEEEYDFVETSEADVSDDDDDDDDDE